MPGGCYFPSGTFTLASTMVVRRKLKTQEEQRNKRGLRHSVLDMCCLGGPFRCLHRFLRKDGEWDSWEVDRVTCTIVKRVDKLMKLASKNSVFT